METNKKKLKTYKVKVLDIKYETGFEFLGFRLIHYKTRARCEEDALQKAKKLYMQGKAGEYVDEIPILLKIFSLN